MIADTITLAIGTQKVTMTIAEARELHAKLADIFDRCPVYVPPVFPAQTELLQPIFPTPGPMCIPTKSPLPTQPLVICSVKP